MNNSLYEMIFKRKSFHVFKENSTKLTDENLNDIEKAFAEFEPLYKDIKVKMRVVKTSEIAFKKDAEACLLLYSEDKDNYLLNVGYLGQQLDLYLASRNIGACWFGLGKTDLKEYEGLKFVIMIAIGNADESEFRKDMYASKRKELSEIWSGDELGIANIVRFSPSAVNSQPWYTVNKDGVLTVYRKKKKGLVDAVMAIVTSYFNLVDMGIYLCILELCMNNKDIAYERKLFVDNGSKKEDVKVAEYILK